MIRIQKLSQPRKTSGHLLGPNKSTKVKGIVITNTNSFGVYVDRFQRKKAKSKKKLEDKK